MELYILLHCSLVLDLASVQGIYTINTVSGYNWGATPRARESAAIITSYVVWDFQKTFQLN